MSNRQIGYCTNVHAGATLAQTLDNLRRYALDVKSRFSPDDPMGIGLWLAAPAARELIEAGGTEELASWLDKVGLIPFTLNGFPYGDFHQDVVKHEVYKPTWFEQQRHDYTIDLIEILHGILPANLEGSISTLPIVWGNPTPTSEMLQSAARHLCGVAEYLQRLEADRGRLIYICIEPEPGCYLQRSEDVVHFFENYLFSAGSEDTVRRYLRVCHDVCHAAVMFEDQADVLHRFETAGIQVGKVQVSSAVHVPFHEIAAVKRKDALHQLAGFAEDRYLHQTMVKRNSGSAAEFHEDLPLVLNRVDDPERLTGEWRIHFHVPIYLDAFGLLKTSQPQIRECMQSVSRFPDLVHFEVETYAWGVLPSDLQQPELAAGIAAEMQWFSGMFGLNGNTGS